MTNGLIQHVTVEESTHIQWVKKKKTIHLHHQSPPLSNIPTTNIFCIITGTDLPSIVSVTDDSFVALVTTSL